MINYSTRKLLHEYDIHKYDIMDISRNRDQNEHPLLGKAVLLIGNDTAVVHSLIMQMAQKGADVALLCGRFPTKTVQRLKAQVQALGSHLFLVQQADNEGHSIGQLVHYIAAEWGPIDFFIDLSARQSSAAPPEDGTEQESEAASEEIGAEPLWNLKPWQVTQVVLEAMTQA